MLRELEKEAAEAAAPDELAGYVARSAILREGVACSGSTSTHETKAISTAFQGNESGTAWDVVAGWRLHRLVQAI